MFYRPILPNGKKVPLTWQIVAFFINVTWPLNNNASTWIRLIDRCRILFCVWLLATCILFEYQELIQHKGDIIIMIQISVTITVAAESLIRMCFMAFDKEKLKEYLKGYYLHIYFDEETHGTIHRRIRKQTMPALMYSYSYIATLISYLVGPMIALMDGQRILPFQMKIPFNYQPLLIYTIVVLLNWYIGILVVTNIISESYLLVTSILNLNDRLVLLEQDIMNLGDEVLKSDNPETIADVFCEKLILLVKRNEELFSFAEIVEAQFTRPLFIMMSNSALLLCLVAFNAHETGLDTENITYATWLSAKVAELVVLGYLGSLISARFDGLGNTYYSSNWEKIIYKSTNTEANIRTMKLMTRAITINQRPFMLTGMGFFHVNLGTTVTLLRVAGSYFTFLCSMR
ncbi:odorant receptor 74a-like isoform X2 [Eurosta solidaginis]|uniref:odorant receptor 74a-like isoform X2 n=1 Tax=Eurosta solidaginis TaxID=178769 RepID=UPI003530E151